LHRNTIAKIIIFFFSIHFALAQSIEPKAMFLQNEIKIGEDIQFALSVKYDRNLNILLPDSLYRFGNFEYNRREYFITKTDSAYSYDSVVYHLATFELDSIQYLQLPVYVVNDDDSLAVFSNIDSIMLIKVIQEIPENPELKENAEFVNIHKQFNYPYLLIGLGILGIMGLIVMLFFGKQLVKAWRVYRLKQGHKRFTKRFFNLMRDISGNNPSNTIEHVLAVWKNYLEKLERKPISKLTTKEILVLHNNSELKENLHIIDRSIYGGEKGNDLFSSFDYLMRFSVEIYNDKIKEIKNG
jgi:hypothetical protein